MVHLLLFEDTCLDNALIETYADQGGSQSELKGKESHILQASILSKVQVVTFDAAVEDFCVLTDKQAIANKQACLDKE